MVNLKVKAKYWRDIIDIENFGHIGAKCTFEKRLHKQLFRCNLKNSGLAVFTSCTVVQDVKLIEVGLHRTQSTETFFDLFRICC